MDNVTRGSNMDPNVPLNLMSTFISNEDVTSGNDADDVRTLAKSYLLYKIGKWEVRAIWSKQAYDTKVHVKHDTSNFGPNVVQNGRYNIFENWFITNVKVMFVIFWRLVYIMNIMGIYKNY